MDDDVTAIVEDVLSRIRVLKGKRCNRAIGMFDLCSSTPLKLRVGHTLGTRTALAHNLLCRRIADRFGGLVVKELGDGVLVKFNDAVDACLAAIDIKKATKLIPNCKTRVGMTFGAIEELRIAGVKDILGTAVDRCARLQSLALPNQILVDKALHDTVESFIRDSKNICFSEARTQELKGIGPSEFFELSTNREGFVEAQHFPLTIHEEGRLLISEKVAFMKNARSEVIELGIGLTTFTGYFTNRNSKEFKDHVIELLSHGVKFKCLALNPDSPAAKAYAADRDEKDLVQGIRKSLDQLRSLKEEFISRKLKGSFDIYLYSHFPYFHAVCVDPTNDWGRLTVSPYMFNTARADTPVMQFSKLSNPAMFDKYWASLRKLLSGALKLQ
jgi:class 3 adenylate cyclase